MPDAGAVTLDDCHRQGWIMIEIGCVRCPRYGSHRIDKLIALCGPYSSLEQLAAFMSWDCPKRQASLIDDPCRARCHEPRP